MKLSFEEVCILKHICVKAQQFELSVKFRDEEKRIWDKLPKKEKERLTAITESVKEDSGHTPIATVNIPFTIDANIVTKLSYNTWKPTNSE